MKPVEHYLKTFHIRPALTEADYKACFNIRYQVYCREFGFESPPDDGREMEIDEYDKHALHCLLIHNQTQRVVGSVRLVINNRKQPLPLMKFCHQAIDLRLFDPESLRTDQTAEFSRMAIIEEFRRREKQQLQSPGKVVSIHDERRYSPFPVIPVCLFIAALAMFADSQAEFGLAMMEPKLFRLLRKHGIRFQTIGHVIDYHGRRAPYMINRESIPADLPEDIQALFAAIQRQWREGLLGIGTEARDQPESNLTHPL